MTFADILRDELRRRGLLAWAESRSYSEVIAKPEVLQAHGAAWEKYMPCSKTASAGDEPGGNGRDAQ